MPIQNEEKRELKFAIDYEVILSLDENDLE